MKPITPDKAGIALLAELLDTGGSIPLRVTGSSMAPTLHSLRDTVYIRKPEGKDLRRGAIVLFIRADGSPVLHRIRKKLPDGQLLMNGDAQSWCERIPASTVMAVVTHICQNGRELPCDAPSLKLWNLLWYPTRPIRPLLFGIWTALHSRKKDSSEHE